MNKVHSENYQKLLNDIFGKIPDNVMHERMFIENVSLMFVSRGIEWIFQYYGLEGYNIQTIAEIAKNNNTSYGIVKRRIDNLIAHLNWGEKRRYICLGIDYADRAAEIKVNKELIRINDLKNAIQKKEDQLARNREQSRDWMRELASLQMQLKQ